jgi:two-component system invasion response regulator UvrY
LRILITDDHSIVRDGLKEILKHIAELVIIEEANNGKEALALTSEKTFDLILLDISLPDISGLDVLKKIINKYPNQKVLILSMFPQEQYALRALKTGASGYLTKNSASDELIEAARKIIAGGKYISASVAENLTQFLDKDYRNNSHESLSNREFEVFIKIATGKSLRQIGEELQISEKSVSTYRTRIIGKTGMKSNSEIIQYCIQNKLI